MIKYFSISSHSNFTIRIITIFFCLCYYSSTYSQTLKTAIYTEDGVPITDCQFYINKTKITPNSKDNFYYLTIKEGDMLTLKKEHFDILNYDFPAISKNDTLTHLFILHDQSQKLEEFIVVGKKNNQFAGDLNENLLDYIIDPTRNCMIIIKSIKNNYYIEYKDDTISRNYLLNIHPESLQLDFMGNIQLLSIDSSYQIWITQKQEIEFIDVLPLKEYNLKIKPNIAKRDHLLFSEEKTYQNQEYHVKLSNKSNPDSLIYKVLDKVAAKVAEKEYNEILQLYQQVVPKEISLIDLGIWDGNMIQLGETPQIIAKISWHKILSKPINCSSFGMLDYICTVNLFDSVISKIDYNGNQIDTIPLNIKGLKNIQVIYDYFYDKIFLSAITIENERIVYQIDEKTGVKKKVGNLNGNVYPTKVKIAGNYIYYIRRNEAGYNKLYRKGFKG